MTPAKPLADTHARSDGRSVLDRLRSPDTSGAATEAGIATLRVVAGVSLATLHGWHKVVEGWQYLQGGTHWPLLDDTMALGFPLPVLFTGVAAAGQFLGGWMLAVGAFTRVAALLVASTLLTALFHNLQTSGPDAQLAGLYALVTGAFVLIGGSRWSVDRITHSHAVV